MMISSISYLPSSALNNSQGQAGAAQQNPAAQPNSQASVIAQLSSLGQVQQSLTDLRDKATALKTLSSPPSLPDFSVLVQGFVQSFNSINTSVKDWASKQNSVGTENRSAQTLNSIGKTANYSATNSLSSLQKYGISQQANGMYSVNQKQLEKSYQDNRGGTLSAVSNAFDRVAQTADKQFSELSVIDNKMDKLSARANDWDPLGTSLQNTQNNLLPPADNPASYAARNAVNSYSSVASI